VLESAATPYFVIDARDETLADATRYRRLHVVIGDANMSEVATYLKVGTTALLLDMVEDGMFGPDLTLQSATSAIHDISADPTLRKTVTLQDGRRFTALELQMEYLELATRYVGSIGASAKARELLRRWADVLSKLAADPMQLERQVDWVTKWALMERFIGRHRLSWQDPKVGLLDLNITTSGGRTVSTLDWLAGAPSIAWWTTMRLCTHSGTRPGPLGPGSVVTSFVTQISVERSAEWIGRT